MYQTAIGTAVLASDMAFTQSTRNVERETINLASTQHYAGFSPNEVRQLPCMELYVYICVNFLSFWNIQVRRKNIESTLNASASSIRDAFASIKKKGLIQIENKRASFLSFSHDEKTYLTAKELRESHLGIYTPINLLDCKLLTRPEVSVLCTISSVIGRHDKKSMSAEFIGKKVGVGRQRASQLINQLERKGFLIRSRVDANKRFSYQILRHPIFDKKPSVFTDTHKVTYLHKSGSQTKETVMNQPTNLSTTQPEDGALYTEKGRKNATPKGRKNATYSNIISNNNIYNLEVENIWEAMTYDLSTIFSLFEAKKRQVNREQEGLDALKQKIDKENQEYTAALTEGDFEKLALQRSRLSQLEIKQQNLLTKKEQVEITLTRYDYQFREARRKGCLLPHDKFLDLIAAVNQCCTPNDFPLQKDLRRQFLTWLLNSLTCAIILQFEKITGKSRLDDDKKREIATIELEKVIAQVKKGQYRLLRRKLHLA